MYKLGEISLTRDAKAKKDSFSNKKIIIGLATLLIVTIRFNVQVFIAKEDLPIP